MVGSCNRRLGNTLKCSECPLDTYGDKAHTVVKGRDVTTPDPNQTPCISCAIVCPAGKFPAYSKSNGDGKIIGCNKGSTSNKAVCTACSVGKWGTGTNGQSISKKVSEALWDKEIKWCQTCGAEGPVDNSLYTNTYIMDSNRLVDQEDPSSTEKGVMSASPGWYTNSPGQGKCSKCRDFCPLGQATTQECTATTPRVCEDKVAPQLCTTASWKGPLIDGECAARSTTDILMFESMLDPFEIQDHDVYTSSTMQTLPGTDPTTGFDPKEESEGDEPLTTTVKLVRSSVKSGFIDPDFPYAANMYILGSSIVVKYALTDNAENSATGATRKVTVKDNVPPTLVLCPNGSDRAMCMNAMPSDVPCPLQYDSTAAGIWKSWVGGITLQVNDATTQFEFDVSKGVLVGNKMQGLALAAFERIRDDPSTDPWVVACDVRDRAHPTIADVSAGTAADDVVRVHSKRIANWANVKSYFVGDSSRPRTTENAYITYKITDSAGNDGEIVRKVVLKDKTPPEIFPADDDKSDGASSYATESKQFSNPRRVEAKLQGSGVAFVNSGAVVEDVVDGVLDSENVLRISSGPEEVSDWNDAGAVGEGKGWKLNMKWQPGQPVLGSGGGGVDVTQRGRYKVVYSAADTSGNIGSVVRWVVVVDTTPPTMTLVWPAVAAAASPGSADSDIYAEYVHGHASDDDPSVGVFNFGVPWVDPLWIVEDNNLKSIELDQNVAINVVRGQVSQSNATATTGNRCRVTPSPLVRQGGTADCIDTFAALGSVFTLIYTVDDFSYDDELLVDKRTPVAMLQVKTRTVTIVDELPPVITLRNSIGLEYGGNSDGQQQELDRNDNSGTSIVIIDGEVPVNASTSVPFQDPGFVFTDNYDTNGVRARTIDFSDFELVDKTQMADIKAACKRSRQACSRDHKGKAYVGGLGEAGYPLAPHESYITAPGSDVEIVRSGSDEGMDQMRDMEAYFRTPGTYVLEYVVVDSSGNVGAASRILYVNPESIMQQRAAAAAAAAEASKKGVLVMGVGVGGSAVVVLLLIIVFTVRRKRRQAMNVGSKRGAAGRAERRATRAASHTTKNPVFSKSSGGGGGGSVGGAAGAAGGSRARDRKQPLPCPEIWFHGAIDRVEAEKRLRAAGRASGAYLVRSKEGKGNDGEFVLSLLTTKKVIHYVIKVPDKPNQQISIQGKPLNSRLVRGLRSVVQYLVKYPEEIIAEPLEHPAPIPHRAPELIKQVAAELGLDTSAIIETDDQIYAMSSQSAVGGNGNCTVADRLYAMLTEEYDTYSIGGYVGHPSGVYYRVFLALEEIQPHFPLYIRTAADGSSAPPPKVTAMDVFNVFSQKTKTIAANTPLYARVAPNELAGYLAGDGMQFADEVYSVVDANSLDAADGADDGENYEEPQGEYQPGDDYEVAQVEYASYKSTIPTPTAATAASNSSRSLTFTNGSGGGGGGGGSAFIPEDFGGEDESSVVYAVYASNNTNEPPSVMAPEMGGGYMAVSKSTTSSAEQDIYKNNTIERKKVGGVPFPSRVMAPEVGGGYMAVSKSSPEQDTYKNDTINRKKVGAKSTKSHNFEGEYWYDKTLAKGDIAGRLQGWPNGTFVVRDSASSPGSFGLSYTFNGSVSGKLIQPNGSGGYQLKSAPTSFPTMAACIDYYVNNSSGALKCKLVYPSPSGVGQATYGNVPSSTSNGHVRKERSSRSSSTSTGSSGGGGSGGGGSGGNRVRSSTGSGGGHNSGSGIKRDARKGSVYLGFEEAFETNA